MHYLQAIQGTRAFKRAVSSVWLILNGSELVVAEGTGAIVNLTKTDQLSLDWECRDDATSDMIEADLQEARAVNNATLRKYLRYFIGTIISRSDDNALIMQARARARTEAGLPPLP